MPQGARQAARPDRIVQQRGRRGARRRYVGAAAAGAGEWRGERGQGRGRHRGGRGQERMRGGGKGGTQWDGKGKGNEVRGGKRRCGGCGRSGGRATPEATRIGQAQQLKDRGILPGRARPVLVPRRQLCRRGARPQATLQPDWGLCAHVLRDQRRGQAPAGPCLGRRQGGAAGRACVANLLFEAGFCAARGRFERAPPVFVPGSAPA